MNLQEATVSDSATGYTRRIWRSEAVDEPGRGACIFLDAELYFERLDVVEVLDGLVSAGRLPERDWIFVSNQDAEARHYDYTCSDSYARFIAESVLPPGSGGGNLVCGLSLSGLASAHIVLCYPHLFTGALCQSGSFWWDNERFVEIAAQLGPRESRLWLSVGDQETETGVSHPPTGLRQEVSQLNSVARAAQALRDVGFTVEHRVFSGGHDPAKWKAELPDALIWLLAGIK